MPDDEQLTSRVDGSRAKRLVYIDWFRGVLMAHMALDHTSMTFNARRWAAEFAWRMPGPPPDLGQFLTRFSGVFVAPGFAFIAGFMVWVTTRRRHARGVSEAAVTRRLITRGLLLLALEQVGSWVMFGRVAIMFSVLSSLGVSLIGLALVRRLPPIAIAALAFALFAVHPAVELRLWIPTWLAVMLWDAGFNTGPGGVPIQAIYPVVPWFAIMLAGYVTAAYTAHVERPARRWLGLAVAAGVAFFAIRVPASYGNAYPHDGLATYSFWTFAKYPPDLAWITWSFAWIFGGLAVFRLIAHHAWTRCLKPLEIFGRVPLFFYVTHFCILGLASRVLPTLVGDCGLPAVYLGWLLLLGVMTPLSIAWWAIRRRGRA